MNHENAAHESFLTHVAAGIRPLLREMRAEHRGVVYLAIASRANDAGKCWPAISHLMADTGCTKATIRSAVDWLVNAKLIAKAYRDGNGTVYEVLPLACPQAEKSNVPAWAKADDRVSGEHPVPPKHRVSVKYPVSAGYPVSVEPPERVSPEHPERVFAEYPKGYTMDKQEGDPIKAADAAGGPAGRSSKARPSATSSKAVGEPTHRTPSAKQVRPRAAKLSDEQITAIKFDVTCQSLGAYLLHGPAAVGQPREAWVALPPSPTHWAPATGDLSRPDPDVSPAALAGYMLYRLNAARIAAGQPIEMLSVSKAIGVIKNLRSGMTQAEVVAVIDAVGWKWPQVHAAMPGWFTTLPPMNETFIANPYVLAAAKLVASGRPVPTNTPSTDGLTDFERQLEARVGRRIA